MRSGDNIRLEYQSVSSPGSVAECAQSTDVRIPWKRRALATDSAEQWVIARQNAFVETVAVKVEK